KELATMDDEVPVDILPFMGKHAEPDRSRLRETMERFEFNTLLRRLEELGMVKETVTDTQKILARNSESAQLAKELSKTREAALAWEEKGDEVTVAVFTGKDEALLSTLTRSRLAEMLSGQSISVRKKPIRLISHDYKKFLALVPNNLDCSHDTEVAAYLLKPTARTYSLDQLAVVAGIRVELDAESPDERALAIKAVQTYLLAHQQNEELDKKGLAGLFHNWEMPLVRIFAEMEHIGIKLDLDRLGEISAKVSDRLEQLEDEIHKLAGETFNIDSPQQLATILFRKLKLSPGKKTKTGFSTDASVLKNLRGSHKIIPKIETYRELAKLSNTYLLALPRIADPETWRIHTTFNQTVTATGRISSSNPNLQNIPIRTPLGEKIRDCFVAEEGHRLIVADYSQVELRLMAHLSGEPKLRQAFASGEDVHRDTAAEVFNLKPEEVTSTQRNRAKAVNFGIMYGISGFGLAEQLDISREEAAGYIEAYMARYPKVAAFRESTIEQAREDGFVTTVLGRRRAIPELRSSDERIRRLGERLAVNTVIQGSAADIIKIAMVNSCRALEKEGLEARIVLQVHDELVFEASEAEASAVAELARREMTGAWQLDPPLEVDVGIGETWVEAK
ncbi:MAG: DNA polymerase I, partial [Thermoleophilia bacterium]